MNEVAIQNAVNRVLTVFNNNHPDEAFTQGQTKTLTEAIVAAFRAYYNNLPQ